MSRDGEQIDHITYRFIGLALQGAANHFAAQIVFLARLIDERPRRARIHQKDVVVTY